MRLPQDPTLLTFHVLFVVTICAALLIGGPPERRGALVLAVMVIVQAGAEMIIPSRVHAVDPVALLADFIGLLGFGAIALQAMRYWPIWASALQVLALSAHFARWVDLTLEPLAYAFMQGAPMLLLMLVLMVGAIRHWRRANRHGADPSWRGN